jgi:Ca2+:H+ antiporter
MILLLVLLYKKQYVVIQAAVLGSILATLLLSLGLCLFFGGPMYSEQSSHGAVSELGSDLLLTAYATLSYPYLNNSVHFANFSQCHGSHDSRRLSCDSWTGNGSKRTRPDHFSHHFDLPHDPILYLRLCQMRSHHHMYEVLVEHEEQIVASQSPVHKEEKLCFAECVISLSIALALVTMLAINLVSEIPYIVQ